MVFEIFGEIWSGVEKIFSLISRLLFAPGIILHESAHLYFCKLTKTKVKDYRILELDLDNEAAGWVIHEHPDDSFEQFLISFGPLFINSICAFLSLTLAALFSHVSSIFGWFFVWIFLAAGFSALPSFQDVVGLPSKIVDDIRKGKLLFIFILPFAIIMYVLSFLGKLIPKFRICTDAIWVLLLFLLWTSLISSIFGPATLLFDLRGGTCIYIQNVPSYYELAPIGLIDYSHSFLIKECEATSVKSKTFECKSELIDKSKFQEMETHSIIIMFSNECREWKESDLKIRRGFLKINFSESNVIALDSCDKIKELSKQYIWSYE